MLRGHKHNRLLVAQCWDVTNTATGDWPVRNRRLGCGEDFKCALGTGVCAGETYLFEHVPDADHAPNHQTHQVLGVKLIVHYLCEHINTHTY